MNPALISWDFGLEINVTLEDALFSPKSMAIMQGSGDVVSGTSGEPIYVDVTGEIIETSSTTSLHLKHKFKRQSIYIYKVDDNGRWIDGKQLRGWVASTSTGAAAPANVETEYISWSTGGDTLTANTDGKLKVAVFYKTPITDSAQKIAINSDTFPGTYRVVGDTYARNRSTGKDEYFQFVIHRAKIDPANTITLSADGDPSTFNMSLKVLRNLKDTGMIDLIKYDFDDIDSTTVDLGPSDTKATPTGG